MKSASNRENKKKRLLHELTQLSGLIRGSLIETSKKCGRKSCACAKGKLHPHIYLSTSGEGKGNRIVYVTPEQRDAFRTGIVAYHRVWKIIDQLSLINIHLIKGGKSYVG